MLVKEIYIIYLTNEEGKTEEIEFTSLDEAEYAYNLYEDDDFFTDLRLTSYNFETRKEKEIRKS